MKTLISFSGGRDSGAMVLLLLAGQHPTIGRVDEIVFADTGSEDRATYEYFPYFEQQIFLRFGRRIRTLSWRENKALNYKTLFDYCAEEGKERIPSRMLKWCTDKAKIRPLSRYAQEQYPQELIQWCIGFRGDERHRIQRGRNTVKGFQNLFPLGDMGIQTREDVYQVFKDFQMAPPPHSACWFCPFRNADWFKRGLSCEEAEKLIHLEETVNRRRQAQGKSEFYLKHKPIKLLHVA